MHLPKANKLLLIEPLSAFFLPNIGALSLPAKSTNTNFPKVFSDVIKLFILLLLISLLLLDYCSTSKYICKIACDLEEFSLFVEAFSVLCLFPRMINL